MFYGKIKYRILQKAYKGFIGKANKLLNLTPNTARLLCVCYRSLSHKRRAVLAAS